VKPKLFLTALAAATAISGVASAAPVAPRIEGGDTNLVHKVQQVREADVYFDGRGNRVLVDRETGEIISIRPVRRPMRRALREDDFYYGDNDEGMRRLRRDWEEEFRPYEEPPSDYGALPEDDFGDDEAFPEAPREPAARKPATPKVTRKPLPAPSETASTQTPTQPAVIIEDEPGATAPINSAAREDVAALQILLDRTGASPGVIDGRFGSNVDKALLAYRAITGRLLKSTDTAEIKAQLQATGGDPFTTYTLTQEDVAGPFVASVPEDYSAKAKLERLSFTSVPEMLGERFHMDEKYLRALNPEANFSRVGTIVKVANTGVAAKGVVARIIADKGNKQVRALDATGKLIVAYPATIGSSDTPSPVGTHAVSRVAFNPDYTYNPKINFKQGENDKILKIPPGPNGPVGSIWIALDKPTYGIHGTPEPSKIGKTESHGCVRLTNWDAQELAKIVKAGVPVEFLE
jgi:lipoprotein-anchoring transpeptidase ErfK/SrfK